MMNIYRTIIKLRAAANQAIYLVIFHWVVGVGSEISVSLYARKFGFLNWKVAVGISYADSHASPCPPPTDAHDDIKDPEESPKNAEARPRQTDYSLRHAR